MCSTCKLIKRKKHKFVLNELKLWKKQHHIVKIFYMWMLCITLKEKKYKTVCAELAFADVTFDRMVMICFIELVMISLFVICSWIIAIFKECLIKSRNSHCLYAHKLLYFNVWKLFQKWKKLHNVRHIRNVFKFWGIFSTFLN